MQNQNEYRTARKARKLSAIKSMLNYFYKRDLILKMLVLRFHRSKYMINPLLGLINDGNRFSLTVVEKIKIFSQRQDNYNSELIKPILPY